MRWTDLPDQPGAHPLEEFLARLAPDDALQRRWISRLRRGTPPPDAAADPDPGLWVAIDRAAATQARQAVDGVAQERGGLLVGCVHEGAGARPGRLHGRVVHVRRAVAGAAVEASPVSLRLPADTWSRAQAAAAPGERVVGWFHSHPGLGAFFSDTDRATQAAFFRAATSLGWVIDPQRREQAWFAGAASAPIPLSQVEFV